MLFVSHNMPAVTRLCSRIILLGGGKVIADGPSHEVASLYMNAGNGSKTEREWPEITNAPGDEVVRLCGVRARNQEGRVLDTVDIKEPVGIEIEYEVLQPGHRFIIYYHVWPLKKHYNDFFKLKNLFIRLY